MTTELSCRRKADRIEMVRQIADLARSLGATVTTGPAIMDDKGLRVEIVAAHGLSLNLEFKGSSRGTHVLSWHFNCSGDIRLSPNFAPSVNDVHGRKATHVCYDFAGVKRVVEDCLRMARDGTAFTGRLLFQVYSWEKTSTVHARKHLHFAGDLNGCHMYIAEHDPQHRCGMHIARQDKMPADY